MHGPRVQRPTPLLAPSVAVVEPHLISKLKQTRRAGYAARLGSGCDSLLHHMSRSIWLAGTLKPSEDYEYLFDTQVGPNADVVVRT